jgi:hypothetical protein
MPASVSLSTGNYVRSARYGVLSSTYFIGQTTSAPAAGDADGSNLRELEAVKTWPVVPVAADRPSQTGSGGVYARFLARPNELPSADPTFGSNDKTFGALCESMINRAVGGGQFLLRGAYSPTYRNLIFVVQGPALSKESSSQDEGMWEGTIYLNMQAQHMGRNSYETGNLPDYGYAVVSNYGTRHIWGQALTVPNDGDTKSVMVDFTWPYQLDFQRWTQNGVLLTYNVEETIAEDSSDNLALFNNGTALTWVASGAGAGEFSADASAGTITIGAVGSSSDILIGAIGFLGTS